MFSALFKYIFDLIQSQTYYYPISSVGKLTWFYDPNIIRCLFLTLFLSIIEVRQKANILCIFYALGNMKR